MMKKLILASFVILLTGCVMSPTDTSRGNTTYFEYVRNQRENETGEINNDYGRVLQKEKLSNNEMNSYTDPTITERTEMIKEELMKNRDISMTEVHELDDKIFIAVRLTDNIFAPVHDEDIIPDIEKRVQRIIGNTGKEIIVWTDHTEWKSFRNENATPQIINMFNEFFDSDD